MAHRFEEGVSAAVLFAEPDAGAGKPARQAAIARIKAQFPVAKALAGLIVALEGFAHALAQDAQKFSRRFTPAQIADQLLVFMIVQDHFAVFVQQGDSGRGGVHHRLNQGFLIAHLLFQPMQAADITMNA